MGKKSASEHIRDLAAGQQAGHETLRVQESFHQRQSQTAAGDWPDLPGLDHPPHVILQVMITLTAMETNYRIRIIFQILH